MCVPKAALYSDLIEKKTSPRNSLLHVSRVVEYEQFCLKNKDMHNIA